MRAAMARAEVGDDVYGDDPTVRALEERTAAILGKEAAVFMPTGTMSNQVGLRAHTEAGDEILADAGAHIFTSEGGAPAGLSGIQVRGLPGVNGIFTGEDVLRAIRVPHRFNPKTLPPPTKLLAVENTHNGGGGTIWPLERIEEVTKAARSRGLALHLDGARLWNASAATGIPESKYSSFFDTVSVCFSKGLGAPVGSALAGPASFIERARRFKQMFGGGLPPGGRPRRRGALCGRQPPQGPGQPTTKRRGGSGGGARRASRNRDRYRRSSRRISCGFASLACVAVRFRRAMPRGRGSHARVQSRSRARGAAPRHLLRIK